MRILYISRSYTTHDYRFLASFAKSSHDLYFLQLDLCESRTDSRELPVGVTRVPWRRRDDHSDPANILSSAPDFEEALQHVRPDVIHAGPVQSSAFMAAMFGFHPLVTMSWGSDLLVDAGTTPLMNWVTRYTLSRSDLLVTDCEEVSRAALALSGHKTPPILQIPWGIDLRAFSPERPVSRACVPPDWNGSFVFLSTRAWEDSYGIRTLLQGFHKAVQRLPQLRLMLLGDGSLRDFVHAHISENNLSGVINTPGQIPYEELPDFFRSANAYVSCSFSDGTSVSLLEAMATGLPAIVTKRPSNQEWITEGFNGLLVPFGDPEALSTALLRIAALNQQEQHAFSRRNREIVEQRADWESNFAHVLDAYEKLCAIA
jgi:L-malate glycosyltransferase